MSNRLKAALAYQKLGYAVIPLHTIIDDKCSCRNAEKCTSPGKHPRTMNGVKEATKNPATITKWWTMWPDSNIGIATGEASGFIVIDVDVKNDGINNLKDLESEFGDLPDTIEQLTGSGGRHILFRYPGSKTENKVGIAPGIDIRGDGGYIVAAPSIHISGRKYEWEASSRPGEAGLAELSGKWLKFIQGYHESTPTQEYSKVDEVIPEGSRNRTLFELASSLRAKGLAENEILAAVKEVNASRCLPPLSSDELSQIVSSAGKYEPGKLRIERSEAEANKKNNIEEPWGDPEPIESELLPVQSLPSEIIPNPFIPWLEDTSHRMQCPLDFVTVGAMVVCSSVIGAGCAIRPKARDNWEVVPNLWGGIVARPSMLKSPSLAEVMAPLSRIEAEFRDFYEESLSQYEAEYEGYKATREAAKSEMVKAAKKKEASKFEEYKDIIANVEEPEPPKRRRLKTNDSTIEKLGELLNDNPRGLLVFRDELVGLLSSWEREDRQQDRTFYLEGWNGNQGFTFDRIGRGTIDTKNICISLLGGIQPSKLTAYLLQSTSSLTNDGMIQRFQLLVYPNEKQDWKLVDTYPDREAKNKAYEIIKNLVTMDFIHMGAISDDNRPYFRFTEDGQAIFYEWLTELESKIRTEDNPLIAEHLAKYRSLMPAVALIHHLIGVAAGESPGLVNEESAIKAAGWCEYLESHARRIYGLIGDIGKKSAAELAYKIQKGLLQDRFTKRDVYRNGWHLLNREQTDEAIKELLECNWLKAEIVQTDTKPKEVFIINPKNLKNA